MRKELLLCLALAACNESNAADFSAIKQTADHHTWKQTVAGEATPPSGDVLGAVAAAKASEGSDSEDVLGAVAAAKSEGSGAIIKAEMDDGAMWAAADSDKPIRGAMARELAAKFPLPSPDDIAITTLIHSGKDGTWMISYETKLPLAVVAEYYKKAYAAKGLEVTHRLAVEETTEQWIQLGADSATIHALATIKREEGVTTVMVQWDPKD